MTTVAVSSQSLLKAAAPQNQFTSTIVRRTSSLGSVKNVSKSFGLNCYANYKASMAVYKVKVITPEGEEHEFEAPDDTYILDAAGMQELSCHTLAGLGLAVPALGRWLQVLSTSQTVLSLMRIK